ncbi:TetR/AcrR family transcriptional regulator [Aquihabitans sp. McL0605]|uniref:TetR/AcrR family transcriptional regulator n=1 Tax=Aquihabitans sp. McL0605 TaxID=3415671 RepID=UPI003CF7ECE7
MPDEDAPPTRTVKPSRWAGIPADERTRDRRVLLIAAAFDLFGTEGDAATSVRAVCRSADLNARYFYESFVDRDELLGAVYDEVAVELADRLGTALLAAPDSPAARTRAGIDTVLRFITDDPRRARVLFTEGRGNPVLADRRRVARQALVEGTAAMGQEELGRRSAAASASAAAVAATLFGGAMEELAEAWTDGRLGDDLDQVIDDATELSLAIFERARTLGHH